MANTSPWPSAGDVGIGTTTPSYLLVISNGGAAGLEFDPTGFILSGGVGIQGYNRSTSSYVPVLLYGSEILLGGGKVGIGTTTPGYALDVTGSVNVSSLSAGGIVTSTAGLLGVASTIPASQVSGLATVATTGAYGSLSGSPSSLPPNGSAGGDLAGSFPNPTIAANAVTNAKAAQMTALTLKGNNTGSTANPTDLTIKQTGKMLAATVFDLYQYGGDPTGAGYSDTALGACMSDAVSLNGRFKIRCPAGSYKFKTLLSATLTSASDGFSFEGDGGGATVFRWDSAAAGNSGIKFVVNSSQSTSPAQSPYKFIGITFLTQGASLGPALSIVFPDVTAINIANVIEDCHFMADSSGGIWSQAVNLTNPYWTIFRGCVVNTTVGVVGSASGSNSLDGLWFDQCNFTTSGYCVDLEGNSTGWQSVWFSDCVMIGTTCIHGVMGGASGGAEDWVIRDCYINNRGNGSYGVDLTGVQRPWIHDCFFDFASGMAGCINLNGCEEIKIHHNMLRGNAGSETAITLTGGSGGKIDNNEFSNFAHDITLSASTSTVYAVQNQYLNGGSTNYSRAPVVSDSGFRNLFDIPVLIGALPIVSEVPVGWRGFVSNGLTSPTWGAGVSTTGSAIQPVFCDGTNWRYG